jgi:NitT/TauT family transport system ATP-binding protein
MADPVISVQRLAKHYYTIEQKNPEVIEAIREINLDVFEGEFVSLLGPTGCGKSTLLNIIGGLIRPTKGNVIIEGEVVTSPHPKVTMVFQEFSVFPWRTTLQNVEFGLELKGMEKQRRRQKCREILSLVGLSGFENRYPSELSGGMNQRVAIARALALDPDILLMDEPFGALDEQTRLIMGAELLRIWYQTKKTILFVTHSISEAIVMYTRIAVLSARPCTIKELISVDLPTPRNLSTFTTDAFKTIQNRVWDTLREESIKGLKEGEGRLNEPLA